MSAKQFVIETVLRDDDDMSGQTIREWKIVAEHGTVKICLRHGDGFILMRPDDVEEFVSDIHRARDVASLRF